MNYASLQAYLCYGNIREVGFGGSPLYVSGEIVFGSGALVLPVFEVLDNYQIWSTPFFGSTPDITTN